MSASIARILLKIGAVTLSPSRPYTWASGIRSPIYCDNRLLLSYPQERQKIINGFLKIARDQKFRFDGVAGIATAGIPHAAFIADRLKKPLIYVRASQKGHGKQNQIEGCLKKGSRWLVIEDLVSTGGSSLKAVQAIKKAGGKVVACVAIFTYGFKEAEDQFRKARCPLLTLTDFSTLLKEARRQKKITPREEGLLLRFQKNPHNWR